MRALRAAARLRAAFGTVNHCIHICVCVYDEFMSSIQLDQLRAELRSNGTSVIAVNCTWVSYSFNLVQKVFQAHYVTVHFDLSCMRHNRIIIWFCLTANESVLIR